MNPTLRRIALGGAGVALSVLTTAGSADAHLQDAKCVGPNAVFSASLYNAGANPSYSLDGGAAVPFGTGFTKVVENATVQHIVVVTAADWDPITLKAGPCVQATTTTAAPTTTAAATTTTIAATTTTAPATTTTTTIPAVTTTAPAATTTIPAATTTVAAATTVVAQPTTTAFDCSTIGGVPDSQNTGCVPGGADVCGNSETAAGRPECAGDPTTTLSSQSGALPKTGVDTAVIAIIAGAVLLIGIAFRGPQIAAWWKARQT